MPVIVKSEGVNASERFLANLAERTFLSLWSYPNVYRDKGKELCDLLVVCGYHVILFSDKSVTWPMSLPVAEAWKRWHNRAISKSAAQLRRAIGWIRANPDRIYLDAKCTQRFPYALPSSKDIIVHGIIVARGATQACLRHFGAGSGSLILAPKPSNIKLDKSRADINIPFSVCNPSDGEDIYHVFDDVSLPIVLTELDTISDLVRYLAKKEQLLKNNQLIISAGEEDLLAVYLKDVNETGEHDFVVRSGKSLQRGEVIIVEEGAYAHLRDRSEYRRKKEADRISYFWDKLIDKFAINILTETQYFIKHREKYQSFENSEKGLRHLALADRLERRLYATAMKGAFEKIGKADRFCRSILPGLTSSDPDTAFFFLLLKRDGILSEQDDDDYRVIRTNFMYVYAMRLLQANPHLKRAVGIGTEGELARGSRSEDTIYVEQPTWTAALISEIEEASRKMDIYQRTDATGKDGFRMRPFEYPPSHEATGATGRSVPYYFAGAKSSQNGNRKERRRAAARKRRRS